jgi:lipoate-protein ligase A
MRLLLSPYASPAANAALEEHLHREGSPTLLFYRNAPCVVIGRNQNPFREVNLRWCRAHALPVIRRFSGGGAVYHDDGNLNYAFIVPRDAYQPDRYVGIALAALHSLGASDAVIGMHHGIFIGDRKCSGSAFALNAKTALLHGCLLVSADLGRLHDALAMPPYEFAGGGIASVRSPVANLSAYIPGLEPERLRDVLIREAENALGCRLRQEDVPAVGTELLEKYAGDAWNFGATPAFTVRINGTLFTVRKGNWP